MKRKSKKPCSCERPGYYCSGLPGVLAHVENGHIVTKVQRCDDCLRFNTDLAAENCLRKTLAKAAAPTSLGVELVIEVTLRTVVTRIVEPGESLDTAALKRVVAAYATGQPQANAEEMVTDMRILEIRDIQLEKDQ